MGCGNTKPAVTPGDDAAGPPKQEAGTAAATNGMKQDQIAAAPPPSKPTPSNPTQAAAEAYMAAFNAKDAAAAQATFADAVSLGNNKGIGAPKPMPTEKIIGALKGVMFESFGFTFVDPAVTINGMQAVIDTKLKVDTTLPAWETASGKPAPFPPVPVKEMVRVTGDRTRPHVLMCCYADVPRSHRRSYSSVART
jgi:hypothetical protein